MRTRIAIAVLLAGMFAGAQLLRRAAVTRGGAAGARLFDQVLARVEGNYVDTIAPEELYRKAATGMVAELHDPNTSLLDRRQYRALEETTAGAYEGIGVQVDVGEGWLRVIVPVAGGPAELAGLRAGDRILEIDGRSVSARLATDARTGLRGKPGTKVTLLVERPGADARFTIEVVRAAIHLSAVRHVMMLAPATGYLQLAVFSDSSAPHLRAAIARLRALGARTVLLDLRGDPGGLLQQGVAVSDEFLDAGQPVVSLRGRTPAETRTITDTARQSWPDLVLVVLVDGGSASASEIVAGALQDHDRAAVVGRTTYGKGSAQSIIQLDGDSAALRLTTALWYTPSGRSIQRPRPSAADSAAAEDSAAERPLAHRRAFRTDAGRVVYGGGGITPDLIIAAQDSVDGMLALMRALGRDASRFRDAVVDVAASLRPVRITTAAGVTPAMRESVWKRAQARHVKLSRAEFDVSAPAVDRMLVDEMAREGDGAEAAYRLRLDGDRVVKAALALADGAPDQRALLARAAERRAAHREDVATAP